MFPRQAVVAAAVTKPEVSPQPSSSDLVSGQKAESNHLGLFVGRSQVDQTLPLILQWARLAVDGGNGLDDCILRCRPESGRQILCLTLLRRVLYVLVWMLSEVPASTAAAESTSVGSERQLWQHCTLQNHRLVEPSHPR